MEKFDEDSLRTLQNSAREDNLKFNEKASDYRYKHIASDKIDKIGTALYFVSAALSLGSSIYLFKQEDLTGGGLAGGMLVGAAAMSLIAGEVQSAPIYNAVVGAAKKHNLNRANKATALVEAASEKIVAKQNEH